MPRVDRVAAVFALALVVCAVPARPRAQSPEPPPALAAMRAALGGPALDAVKNFTVTGASTRQIINGDQSQSLELYCEFPDKFVQRTEFSVPGPVDIETIIREGFNGAVPISEIVQHSTINMPAPPPPVATSESPAAARAKLMSARHTAFARTMVPMLGAAPAVASVTFESAAATTSDGHAADVVIAREGPTELFQLVIDQASHLPLKVTWKAPPMLMVSSVSSVTVAVRNGTATTMRGAPVNMPPSMPAGHPPPGTVLLDGFPADPNAYLATLPLVQHELVFSQFETVDGVTWPRRWKEYADGKILEDTRLGKFKINTRIDPRKFEISK